MPLQETLADPVLMPTWWPEAALWLGLGALIALVAAAVGVWVLVRRMEGLRSELGALEELREIQRRLDGWLGQREDLDLRRLEHLLVDLRDGTRRVEDLLLRREEVRAAGGDGAALVPAGAPGVAERVINRLTALGYERIELVTTHEALAELAHHDGEVLVEARRSGALHKGRVRLRGGRIDAVHLQPAYPIFP